MKKSILIVDPQYLTQQGLKYHLESDKALKIDLAETLPNTQRQKKYDIIITDYLSPYTGDVNEDFLLTDFSRIKNSYLVISSDKQASRIRQLLRNGVKGYLTKDCSPDEISLAVSSILKGERFYCNTIIDLVAEQPSTEPAHINLTSRETEIILLIAKGYTTQRISDKLHISVHTVNSHRKNILKKLNLSTPAELMAYAHQNGFSEIL